MAGGAFAPPTWAGCAAAAPPAAQNAAPGCIGWPQIRQNASPTLVSWPFLGKGVVLGRHVQPQLHPSRDPL
jgi:hypothetical protein